MSGTDCNYRSNSDSINKSKTPVVALITWGDLWEEDFLDTIKISFKAFCETFVGSWMFNYIEAMKHAGIQTTIFCFSDRVKSTARFVHKPTGAPICMIPASSLYLTLRRFMLNPYGDTVNEVFGNVEGGRRWTFALFNLFRPYLSTPIITLARELRREGCSVILCQGYDYGRFDVSVFLGKILRVPVFGTFQGGVDRQIGLVESLGRSIALYACSGLIIASIFEGQRMQLRYGFPVKKIANIFNPVDLSVWRAVDQKEARTMLGIPLDARVAVWHGRVEFGQKGLDILLDAWERLCIERPEKVLRLILVGTGPDAEALCELIKAKQLQGVIVVNEFVNDRSEIRRYLSAADVYAFPSRAEGGSPVAPIEAMACGLPVVASESLGVVDLFQGGEESGGLLVSCNDGIEFARALGCFLDNEEWGREIGRRARLRVEASFSLESVGQLLRRFLLGDKEQDTQPFGNASCFGAEGVRILAPLMLRAVSPDKTQAKIGFNIQPDGQSAICITAEHATPGTLVAMGNSLLVTAYRNSSFLTALVPKKFLKKPGRYDVCLTDGHRKSNSIEFTVNS
jgi:glycosyltransferase involved in cell wall biosynthesis